MMILHTCQPWIIQKYFDDDQEIFDDLMRWLSIEEDQKKGILAYIHMFLEKEKLNQTVALPHIKPGDFMVDTLDFGNKGKDK